MKNSLCPLVLIAALLGPGLVRAQQAPGNARVPGPNSNAQTLPGPAELGSPLGTDPRTSEPQGEGQPQGGPPVPPPGLPDYLGYLRHEGCCGPVGRDGPVNCEIFFRPGVSFPFGGYLGKILDPGLMIQGGARTLFFTARKDLAWTIELGLSSVWYDVGSDQVANLTNVTRFGAQGPENIPLLPVIPSSLSQTYVHLSGGHQFYVWGSSDCGDDDPKWRLGYDLGGRWGTAKLIAVKQPFIDPATGETATDLNAGLFKHRTDVVGGLFGALHTDIEVPFKCAMLFAGIRTEFAYIWADLLQPQNNTEVFMINVLANFGVRF